MLTTAGLYSWPYDFKTNRVQIRGLGTNTLRLGMTGMDDVTWAAVQQDGYDTHMTVSGADRATFADDETWIADYLGRLDVVLGRWPLHWVEIWNEPNFGMWTGATAVQKQAAYGKLLVAAYQHIKTRYPNTGVVGFGAGGASAAAPGFIRGVLAAVPAAASAFDVLSFHPYIGTTAPDAVRVEAWGSWSIEGQVTAIRKLGVTTPIWFTEVGWEIGPADGGTYPKQAASVVSAERQAAYTARLFVLAMRWGVSRVHHMYVVDTDNYNGGFFSSRGPRPQASAMAFQRRVLDEPTSIKTLRDGKDGVHVYRVKTAQGPIAVAWADAGGRLTVEPWAKVWDMYGTRIRGHEGKLRLGPGPVYVSDPSDFLNSSLRRRPVTRRS